MSHELTPERIKSIVSSSKPGYEVDEDSANQENSAVLDSSLILANSPDLHALAKKFWSFPRICG